ncbi:MAG: mechanosensitive ion channel domain-containing protein [Chlamydiota bacterium]|nr:mechanosensitive ion channel domain-containing protein [Chlamydiota bacterium]
MTKYFLRFIFCFSLLIFPSSSQSEELGQQPEKQEATDEEIPDVNELSAVWWSYFDVPENTLQSRINVFISALESIPPTLSPDKQKIATTYIEKTNSNLQTFSQNISRKSPTLSQLPPILNNYTIDDIIRLNQKLRSQKSELAIIQRELSERLKLKSSTENLLEKTKQDYKGLEKRSVSRILHGLELISIRTSLEVLRQNIEYLKSTESVKTEMIQLQEEELQKAVQRIATSEIDIFVYAKKVKETKILWEEARENLSALENEEATALPKSTVIESDSSYIKISQDTDQAEIKEALANNQYTLATLEFFVAQLLTNPEEVKPLLLKEKLQSLESTARSFKEKMPEWTAQAERQLQLTGQILANNGKVEANQKKELSATQQDILSVAQENLVLIQQLNNEIHDTEFLLKFLQRRVSQQIGGSKHWLQLLSDFSTKAYNQSAYWLNKELYTVGKNPVTLFNIIQFLLIIVATVWVSRVLLKTLSRFARQRKGISKSLVYRVSRLFNYLFLGIGLVVALTAIGFDFSSLLLIAGALGVGLGFGLQSIFNNFLSGIIILFESHLKVGDYVELDSGLRGEIREINVRSTVITDNDGIDVLVPNSEIISKKVLNWTLKVPYRRVQVPFSVEYNTDKDLVAKVVVEAAKKIPHTLMRLGIPEPVVRLSRLGDNGMEFELVVWVTEKYTKRTRTTRSDYLWAIETTLRENGIGIPYPKREVYLPKQEERKNS